MRIAYFTPLNPEKSGISDWAEELLPELKKHMDIEIFVNFDPDSLQNKKIKENFKIHRLEEYDSESVRSSFDKAIFQAGNNVSGHEAILNCFMKYGGYLELHDVSMHHYLEYTTVARDNINEYMRILEYCHGPKAVEEAQKSFEGRRVLLWDSEPVKYSVIKHFVDRSEGVIVHSEFAKQMVKGINPEKKVFMIPLPCPEILENPETEKKQVRRELGIPEDQIMIASFGFANVEKRIVQIVEQLAKLNKITGKEFKYYIVGKNSIENLQETIDRLGLSGKVVITGSIGDLEIFKKYMIASDLCFNLRYPTHGETSASLLRLLGYGKHVAVTDIGSFSEFPSSLVFKIRYDKNEKIDILRTLVEYFSNPHRISSEDIISFTKENFEMGRIAGLYRKYLAENVSCDNEDDAFIDRIMDYFPFDESIFEKMCR